VTIYLVRHAKAGERRMWDGDDWLRPLSGRGHAQANALLDELREATFAHVLSSPYVRCMETVVPLAAERGIAVEPVEALAEGATLEEALPLVQKHHQRGAVLCTHGDVMPMMLEHYASRGVDLGARPQYQKGCIWILETDATGEVRSAQYVAPPES
jgi:8-oxo-dGTP diphosphatase